MADPLHLRFELAGVDRAVIHRTLGKVREGIAGAGEAVISLMKTRCFEGGRVGAARGAVCNCRCAVDCFEHDRFGHAILPVFARMRQVAPFVCDRGHWPLWQALNI